MQKQQKIIYGIEEVNCTKANVQYLQLGKNINNLYSLFTLNPLDYKDERCTIDYKSILGNVDKTDCTKLINIAQSVRFL